MLAKHFAHGAGGRLAGQAVDVDLLFFVFFTHQLLLLLRLYVYEPAGGTKSNEIFDLS